MKAGRVRVGVIGVGLMGRRHAENLRWHVPEAELVAVADADLALARRVADELGVLACASVDKLLAREDVRAVLIASPSRFHAEQAVAAARAGKDVLLEKPIAHSLADADRVIAAMREAGVRLQLGFQRRYDAAYLEAKRLIASGALRTPLFYRGTNRDRDAPAGSPGALPREDILTESAIHDFDGARWLLDDEVVSVRAMLASVGDADIPCPNLALVDLRFAGGTLADIETLRGARYGYDIRTEVVCADGTVLIGDHRHTRLQVLTADGARHDIVGGFLDRYAEAYLREVRDFVSGALERRPPAVTGEDGRRALEIALAAAASDERKAEVELPFR